MQKHIETVILSSDHYGRPVGFDIHHYDSGRPGPTVFVQASVHGAELQGNLVIDELTSLLQDYPWQGKISMVPFANPWSSHAHFGAGTYGRFDAMSGRNWNRAYHDLSDAERFTQFLDQHQPSDEDFNQQFRQLLAEKLESINESRLDYGFQRGQKLTFELQKRSLYADIVFDLHTAPVAGLYLYAPVYMQEGVRDLGFPINLIIPDAFDGAGDEAHFAPWVMLRDLCKERGLDYPVPVESYTIELGGEEMISQSLAAQQVAHLAQHLYRRGFFTDNPAKQTLLPGYYQHLTHYKTYYSDRACLCDYQVQPGQYVKAGDQLAILTIRHKNGELEKQSLTARQDCVVVNHSRTSNLQAGSEVFQVLEKPQKY